jgi:hypothetical protein
MHSVIRKYLLFWSVILNDAMSAFVQGMYIFVGFSANYKHVSYNRIQFKFSDNSTYYVIISLSRLKQPFELLVHAVHVCFHGQSLIDTHIQW